METYKEIWKAKIPLKNKIFIWMVAQNAILTKENMIFRNWQGDPACYFCGDPESVSHLLFQCPISKVVWGVLAICFNQKDRPRSYNEFWQWIKRALPRGEEVYMLGLAAVCWTIWNTRNSICFDKNLEALMKLSSWHVYLFVIGQVYTTHELSVEVIEEFVEIRTPPILDIFVFD
jgi:hypothetical protein